MKLRSNHTTTSTGFKLRARGASGFTLAELMIVVGIIALIAAAAIPSLKSAMERSQARNTLRILGEVKKAKEQFRAEVNLGAVDMPTGKNADTLGTYTPTLDDIAPYIKVSGVQEGTPPTSAQLMAGSGQRTLVMGALDTDPDSNPTVPTKYRVQ